MLRVELKKISLRRRKSFDFRWEETYTFVTDDFFLFIQKCFHTLEKISWKNSTKLNTLVPQGLHMPQSDALLF